MARRPNSEVRVIRSYDRQPSGLHYSIYVQNRKRSNFLKSTQVLRLRKSLNFKGLADQTCRHSRTTTQKTESILSSSGVPPEFVMFSFAIAVVWNPLKLFTSLSQSSSDDQERMLLRST